MDATTATLLTFGAAALLASWVVLLIESWKEGEARNAAMKRCLEFLQQNE